MEGKHTERQDRMRFLVYGSPEKNQRGLSIIYTNVLRDLTARQPVVGFPLECVQRVDCERQLRVRLGQQPVQLEPCAALLELIKSTDKGETV